MPISSPEKLIGTQANVYTLRFYTLTVCFKGKTLKKPDIILSLNLRIIKPLLTKLSLKSLVNNNRIHDSIK